MSYIDTENLRCIALHDDDMRLRQLGRRHGGVLHVTSGRVVACDPLVQPDRAAFARQLEVRGDFSVELIEARGTYALAVLWLRERTLGAPEIVRWEPALLPGQDPKNLKGEEFFGYPVDAGFGCFMDLDAASAMVKRQEQEPIDPESNYYESVLAPEIGSDGIVNHYPLRPGTANNIIGFRSGFGDGVYPSYWGLDARESPVALVTDFMVIEGGDARSEEDKRQDVYLASLSPQKRADLEAMLAAVSDGSIDKIRELLESGAAGANEVSPSGETALFCAIRLNKTEALRSLLNGGPCPELPDSLKVGGINSYLDYARLLRKPRDPELVSLLERSSS